MLKVRHVVDHFGDATHGFDAKDALQSQIGLELKRSSKVIR